MPRCRWIAVAPVRRSGRWIGLLITLITALGWRTATVQPSLAAGDCTVSAAGIAMDAQEQSLLSMLNSYRQQNGLNALGVSPGLSRTAAWTANDMAAHGWSPAQGHVDSLGRSPFVRMTDCGYRWSAAGENLLTGYPPPDAATTFNGWKNSPPHNQNMLGAGFQVVGVAHNGGYWAMELGSPNDGGAAPPAGTSTPTPPPVAATATVTIAVRLVGASGQPVQGDLSGFVFVLSGGGTTYSLSPTNAQGQATIAVPAGTYTVSQQPKSGATLVGLTIGGAAGGSVALGAGQSVSIVATDQVAGTTPTTPATATPTPGSTSQQGYVTITVNLLGAGGQPAQGDLSGYVFTLTNGVSTYVLPATNSQGQASIAVPAGTYTVVMQPRQDASLIGVSTSGGAAGTVTVSGGQLASVTATSQLTAPPAAAPVQRRTSESVQLSPVCNNVVLTWPVGTPLQTIAGAISPAGAFAGIWLWDAARNAYHGYAPVASAPSDYTVTRTSADAVFICMMASGVLTRPAT